MTCLRGTTPQTKAGIGNKGSFWGIDLGAKAALILGIEVNFKLGFYIDDK